MSNRQFSIVLILVFVSLLALANLSNNYAAFDPINLIDSTDSTDSTDAFVAGGSNLTYLDNYRIPIQETSQINRVFMSLFSNIYLVKYLHTDKFTKKSTTLSLFYFQSTSARRPHSSSSLNRPTVLVLPPIVAINPIDYIFCRYLNRKGYNAILVPFEDNIFDTSISLAKINKIMINYLLRVKEALDVAPLLPGVNGEQLILTGQSMGGVFSALSFNSDLRTKAAVIHVGGGNIPEILTYGPLIFLKNYRERQLRELNIDRDQFLELAKKEFTVDPLNNPYQRGPENILMFVDLKDKDVPIKNQLELWESYKRPQVEYLQNGHIISSITFNFRMKKVVDYLDGLNL
ncbi:MAG: hypothetical protein HQK53_03145 [Oligoflexia bacterium]|nr:hypothetical protein [Oligoflexia bacterium]